jgi:hypothetical protein
MIPERLEDQEGWIGADKSVGAKENAGLSRLTRQW